MKSIEPLYFGSSTKPLFGCYHAPQSVPRRDCGVVLCYSMGHDYIDSHRAYQQLALRLSHAGFHVLRFDFFGCGDSGGDYIQGRIPEWLTDISSAIDEIRKRSGIFNVCLVGLRLGGSLAMMAGAERGDIAGIVLWDPVVNGKRYIKELTRLHQEMLQESNAKQKRLNSDKKQTEILGFPLTDVMRIDLENLDLLEIQLKPASDLLLIKSAEDIGEERFKEHLKSMGLHLEYQQLPTPNIRFENIERALVPIHVLQTVISWISKMYPR